MTHNISMCKPTFIPSVNTCSNFGSEGTNTSINAGLGPFNYKFDSNNTHQIALCGKLPMVPFGTLCGGIKYDGNNIDPFISIGAKIGNTGYQFKPNIDAIYHKIINTNQCSTVTQNNTVTISCGDTKTTMVFNNKDLNITPGFLGKKIEPEMYITDPTKLNSENIGSLLQKCDKIINNLQNKMQVVMEKKGITQEDIGIIMDRAPLKEIISTPSIFTNEQIETNKTIISVNNIISNVTTNIPNYTIFDVLDGIHKNSINTIKSLEILNSKTNNNGPLKWHVDKNKAQMGVFYPDCCEFANKSGYFVDYHLVHKIDYCRLCMTPFRLEYFL
jgi:hypothetical protein